MTTASPIPAAEAAPRMAHPPDTAPETPPAQPQPQDRVTAAKPTLRGQVAENPLLSFFGLLIIALLAAAVAAPNIRINDTNRRIDRLEDTMTARFAAVDARFDKIETKIDTETAALDAKIDAKIAQLDAKIDAKFAQLDAKIDAKFAQLDAKIAELDAKIDEMHLTLIALVATLGATDDMAAAVGGEL